MGEIWLIEEEKDFKRILKECSKRINIVRRVIKISISVDKN